MKYWEAMRSMSEGGRVRYSEWSEDAYVQFINGKFVNQFGMRSHDFSISAEKVTGEWEVYEKPRPLSNDEKLNNINELLNKLENESDK